MASKLHYKCPDIGSPTAGSKTYKYSVYDFGAACLVTCQYTNTASSAVSHALALSKYSAQLGITANVMWIWGGWAFGQLLPTISGCGADAANQCGFNIAWSVLNAGLNTVITPAALAAAGVSVISTCVGSTALEECNWMDLTGLARPATCSDLYFMEN